MSHSDAVVVGVCGGKESHKGEDTAAAGGGDAGWLVDVPDEEQALPTAPMMISMRMPRQPHPAACCLFCDTGLPHSVHAAV
jgi:hypothetical protein